MSVNLQITARRTHRAPDDLICLSSHYISKINEDPNLNVIVILGPMHTCLLQEWDHTLNRLMKYESGPWWLLSPSFWCLKTCKPGSRELNHFFWLSANFLVGTEIIHSGSEHKILTQVYVQVKNKILSYLYIKSSAEMLIFKDEPVLEITVVFKFHRVVFIQYHF